MDEVVDWKNREETFVKKSLMHLWFSTELGIKITEMVDCSGRSWVTGLLSSIDQISTLTRFLLQYVVDIYYSMSH